MNIKEAYSILKLTDDFNEESLKKAYKREIMKVHPDVNPNLENATELSKKVNEAYDLLKKSLKDNKTTNYDDKKYNNEEAINFYQHKQLILSNINKMLDKIRIEKVYEIDSFFEVYKKYIFKEIELYRNLYEDIKDKAKNERDIILFTSMHQYKIDDLMDKFIYEVLKKFIKKCSNFSNIEWLTKKCDTYINNDKFKPTTINDCMQYYVNVKASIAKRVIDKKINFHISKLSWVNKKYLKDNTKTEIINNLLLKLSPEEILGNENIIRREFKSYINKRRLEYIKFLLEKNYKIINLNFLAFKNDISIDKKQLKRLKLERREDRFNDKYLIFENELMELLNSKTSSKHR